MIADFLGWLIGFALLLIVIASLLAPFESLGWWAGWSGPADMKAGAPERLWTHTPSATQPDARVIVLFGINDAADTLRTDREQRFVADLAAAVPTANVIMDLFPYSAFGMPLNGDRALAAFWDRVARPSGGLTGLLNVLINLRNFLQVLTSADRRYGPFYNFGLAQVVVDALLRDGHDLAIPRPLVLVGYSGGGQLAMGSAGYVHQALGIPVHLVSFGGFMASNPGLDGVARMTHVKGSRDRLQAMAQLLFPQRWPMLPYSHWNRALADGRLHRKTMDGVAHAGSEGYFSTTARMQDGRTHMAATVDIVAAAVRAAISAPTTPPAPATMPEAR